jgi:hypothetical protein
VAIGAGHRFSPLVRGSCPHKGAAKRLRRPFTSFNFNPHVHVLAADGAFLPDGRFVRLPAVPGSLLAEGFRRAVLEFLVNNDALSEGLRRRMLGWRHCGFSAHNEVRVPAEDAEGRNKLAGTRLRAPRSLEKMIYDAATGTVIYRSKMPLGLKRNFQVMPGAEWLALLCKHIPDRYEHLVRYVGWYSNRARGERAKEASPHAGAALPAPSEQPSTEFAARAKATWARLIRKVDAADPLEGPKGKGPKCRAIGRHLVGIQDLAPRFGQNSKGQCLNIQRTAPMSS